jgi:hypothetical protein
VHFVKFKENPSSGIALFCVDGHAWLDEQSLLATALRKRLEVISRIFTVQLSRLKQKKKIIFKKFFFGCMISMMMESSRFSEATITA